MKFSNKSMVFFFLALMWATAGCEGQEQAHDVSVLTNAVSVLVCTESTAAKPAVYGSEVGPNQILPNLSWTDGDANLYGYEGGFIATLDADTGKKCATIIVERNTETDVNIATAAGVWQVTAAGISGGNISIGEFGHGLVSIDSTWLVDNGLNGKNIRFTALGDGVISKDRSGGCVSDCGGTPTGSSSATFEICALPGTVTGVELYVDGGPFHWSSGGDGNLDSYAGGWKTTYNSTSKCYARTLTGIDFSLEPTFQVNFNLIGNGVFAVNSSTAINTGTVYFTYDGSARTQITSAYVWSNGKGGGNLVVGSNYETTGTSHTVTITDPYP